MSVIKEKMTNYRWTICALLFFATTINYLDRQVLSLTWSEFIKPEFHWDDNHYGTITSVFSMVYSLAMLFAGKFIDWMGTRKGFLWAIGVWSVGACLHALCGIITEQFVGLHTAAELMQATGDTAVVISTISMYAFLGARIALAIGESGNFPAAIKVTAEYFPKKDRAYATSIFNAGASVGSFVAPLTIPLLAKAYGWEMAFIIIGVSGFIWMGFWVFMYKKPEESKFVNEAELAYILSDKDAEEKELVAKKEEKPISYKECLRHKQTWSFALGKFMTDGVWWFFLFWTPSYLQTQFGIKSSDPIGIALIFTLYLVVTVLSILGGKLPTLFINRSGQNPYAARMKAMLIFAFFPLAVLLAQPLGMHFAPTWGQNAAWISVLLISIGCAAHQAWSANLFSTIGDMFPKSAIATITGIGGMAGGLSSMILQKSAGKLFVYASGTTLVDGETVEMTSDLLAQGAEYLRAPMQFMGFEGKPAGYFIVFCFCAFAYLIGWSLMKSLVPKYKQVVVKE